MEIVSKKLGCRVLFQTTENAILPYETPLPHILRQVEWEEQNEPITKNGVLPVITLFLRTFYKELI